MDYYYQQKVQRQIQSIFLQCGECFFKRNQGRLLPLSLIQKKSLYLLFIKMLLPHSKLSLVNSSWKNTMRRWQVSPIHLMRQLSNTRSNQWRNRNSSIISKLFKRLRRTIDNSLSLWYLGSACQQPRLNHSLWAHATLQVYNGALRKALANLEVFTKQIPAVREEEDDGHCHKTSKHFLCITFTPDDIQIKEKHDRPVYYTGYIGSSVLNHFQVDPGSALSIMPHRVLQHLGIPTHRPSATQTAIYASTPMVHAR